MDWIVSVSIGQLLGMKIEMCKCTGTCVYLSVLHTCIQLMLFSLLHTTLLWLFIYIMRNKAKSKKSFSIFYLHFEVYDIPECTVQNALYMRTSYEIYVCIASIIVQTSKAFVHAVFFALPCAAVVWLHKWVFQTL